MAEKRGKESKEKEFKIKGDSIGASGFTLGVIGVISLGWFGLLISIVGFVFCFLQQRSKKTKLGKVGLILNLIGFVLSIVWIVWVAPRIAELMQQLA